MQSNSNKPLNQFNTGEWLDHLRERIEAGEHSALEKVWKERINTRKLDRLSAHNLPNCHADSPIEALVDYIECGQYPPPELLIATAQSFRRYFDAQGALSLDQVFFGNPGRGGKHYAKGAKRLQMLALFNRKLEEHIALVKVAESIRESGKEGKAYRDATASLGNYSSLKMRGQSEQEGFAAKFLEQHPESGASVTSILDDWRRWKRGYPAHDNQKKQAEKYLEILFPDK